MRPQIIILLFFAGLIFFGFKPLTNAVYVNGHIRKNPKDTSSLIGHLIVFVKEDSQVLADTVTDEKGDFHLTFTPRNKKTSDFFCYGPGIDTLLLASITTFESETPEMTFYLPTQHKTNAIGKVLCPKCKRTDRVYKIEYGDPPVATIQVSKLGDTTYSPIYKGKYRANCISGPAKYYCDRDKVKF